MEVLSSGKTSFKVEVPYKLFHTGENRPKPLIVYLHGSGQNIESFEKKMKALQAVEAYHLFIQGPYPDFRKIQHRGKWGFGWYLYNGKQGSFIKSLEYTSEFIQSIIDTVTLRLHVNRLCIIGYSMGAYQAGYFALSRWKHTNDLIMIGGRVKAESFSEKRLRKCMHMNVIALHGKDDKTVPVDSQRESLKILEEQGVPTRFLELEGDHKMNDDINDVIISILSEIGYDIISEFKADDPASVQ
ncbi:MAG: hypothetical protein LAT75_02915 [Candidatus Cyclonatronum sp.]|uniref:alpha/beta hydrolase n=1 Tax=Cyclonatronum sp. TaxID=3024185 RepID=UPI0025BB77DC|nr:hypothetical protein [Cyclonatronum sp.]MCC5933441.1 hypothetical protein [Balneolales bacterium]MCH8485788.1 hypothetical protein [Cyclonatronum sp.]